MYIFYGFLRRLPRDLVESWFFLIVGVVYCIEGQKAANWRVFVIVIFGRVEGHSF